MVRLPRAALWTLLPAVLLAASLAAAGDSANPPPAKDADAYPITVTVTPTMVFVAGSNGVVAGRKVVIEGDTLPSGTRPVKIAVSQEGAPAATAEATVGDTGHYTFGDFAPVDDGAYVVTVTAPDGRGTATASFTAVDIPELDEKVGDAITETAKAAANATAAMDKKIDDLPPSPAKDQAKQKLAAAIAATQALDRESAAGSEALKGFLGAIATDAFSASLTHDDLDRLAAAVSRSDAATATVQQLTTQASGALLGCDQLALATEVFKAISAALNVKKEITQIAYGIAKDVNSDTASAMAKKAGASPGLAFVSGQALKNLPELGKLENLAGNAYGILADLGAFVTDSVFGAYCEQFVGPVEAAMKAEFYYDSGNGPQKWWSYTYKVTGRITLYYPKGASGDAIQMKGRIEGYAHDFDTWEDALTVMYPGLMGGTVQYKRNFPPLEVGSAASQFASQGSTASSGYIEGSGAGMLGPGGFLINVDGVLAKDSLTIALGKPVSDFNVSHRVVALVLSPLAGDFGPQVTWYSLPFSDARHLFGHAANDQPMKLTLTTDAASVTADGKFTGSVDHDTAKGDYVASIKACNPGC